MNKKNYLIKSFLTFLGLAFFSLSFGQTYCTTGFTVTGWSKIGNVKLVGNTVTLDNASTACNGYENFTAGVSVPDLAAGGGPYTLTVDKISCGGNWRFNCGAWIDYNADGDFTDAGEYLGNKYYPTAGSSGTVTWSFSTPCTITPGNTRMRVVLWEDGVPNSCTQ
ncbi:GEVED domain-containing protein, partial [Bacteroidia bacterium]|nr:GEVED domain-containing protein [Bacteroidia bacterium]